jgi:hypothetical protein
MRARSRWASKAPCSTSVRRDAAQILRPGGITRDAIEAVIGRLPEAEAPVAEPLRSPGLLARHYAPRTPMRLDAITVEADEALLAFGPELEWAPWAGQFGGKELTGVSGF